MSDTDEIEDSSAPLIEHLAELRTRLIHAVIAFLVGFILCFVFAGNILDVLLVPIEQTMRDLGDPNPVMQYTAPQEYFFTLVRIAMVAGLGISFPAISYQLWRFVAPGLYKNEKSAFLPFLIASPAMFILGGGFAHFVVTPLAMKFFLGFADASSLFASIVEKTAADADISSNSKGVEIVFQGKVNETLDITLKLIVAFGLCFQLPVLLSLMGKAGLVSAEGLKSVRKYAIVGILTLAAIVTPPDVITQVILFVVVYGLYEVSIQLVARFETKREADLRAQGLWFDDEDEEAEDELMAEFDEDEDDDGDDDHDGGLDDDPEDDPGMVETGR